MRILLIGTGSVAVIKTPLIGRELIRRGFEVVGMLSEGGKALLGEQTMRWACNRYADLKEKDHIRTVEEVDCVAVAPATLNTISKFDHDIADNDSSLLLAVAKGMGKPIVFAPAMHGSLYREELMKKIAKEKNVSVVPPVFEEGKHKMAEWIEVCDYIERTLRKGKFTDKKIVVTAGATREYVDDVRFISNGACGKTGLEHAKEFWKEGAKVVLIGNVVGGVPRYLDYRKVFSPEEMAGIIEKETKGAEMFVMSAAVGDFAVKKRDGKIPSKEKVVLELEPREKLWKKSKAKKNVLFKASWKLKRKEMEKQAKGFLESSGAHAIIANDIGEFLMGGEENRVLFVAKDGIEEIAGAKEHIAKRIVLLL